jgi:hypothetical protein
LQLSKHPFTIGGGGSERPLSIYTLRHIIWE